VEEGRDVGGGSPPRREAVRAPSSSPPSGKCRQTERPRASHAPRRSDTADISTSMSSSLRILELGGESDQTVERGASIIDVPNCRVAAGGARPNVCIGTWEVRAPAYRRKQRPSSRAVVESMTLYREPCYVSAAAKSHRESWARRFGQVRRAGTRCWMASMRCGSRHHTALKCNDHRTGAVTLDGTGKR
jgi:hypothetical protein